MPNYLQRDSAMTISNEAKLAFEKLYNKKLTDSEVLEYKTRLIQFFSILIDIDQRNKRERSKNEQQLSNKETDAKAG